MNHTSENPDAQNKNAPRGKTAGLLIPNSTQVPNVLLDRVMPVATDAVFKCLMCVARQTYGWRKEWDAISITQIERLTGLSNKAAIDNMKLLCEAGLVVRRSGANPQYGFEYSLDSDADIEQAIAYLRSKRKQRGKRAKPSGGRKQAHEPGSPLVVNPVHGHEPLTGCTGFMAGSEPGSPLPMNPVHTQKPTIKTNYQKGGTAPPFPSNWKSLMKQIGTSWREAENKSTSENKRRAVFEHVRVSAKQEGLDYSQAKHFLEDHPGWKDWPDLKDLDSQQEIAFPESPKGSSGAQAEYVIAVKGETGARAQQLFSSFREHMRSKLEPGTFHVLIAPMKCCCLTETELHVICFGSLANTAPEQISHRLKNEIVEWLPQQLAGVRFLTADLKVCGLATAV